MLLLPAPIAPNVPKIECQFPKTKLGIRSFNTKFCIGSYEIVLACRDHTVREHANTRVKAAFSSSSFTRFV